MPRRKLKLKQASAVLRIPSKELQNLVQFGVVRPARTNGTYFFDANTLLVAKIAFRLKANLGARTSVLSKLMSIFRASGDKIRSANPKYLVFRCRLSSKEEPIKVAVPYRAMREELEEGLGRAEIYRDLPPGRKRRGWKKEFLKLLAETAKDIGQVSQEEIMRTVSEYRGEKREPEITVAAES